MTPEGEIKLAITSWLGIQQALGRCLFWVQQSGALRGGYRTPRGYRIGIPDIIGSWERRPMAIEVKTPKGKVSPEQAAFISEANEKGWIAFVARSLDDVIRTLEGKHDGIR